MKKIILFALAVMLLTTCTKDMNSVPSTQADASLKQYADIATQAAISYNKGNDNKNDFDKKGDDNNGNDSRGNDNDDKHLTKVLKSSGSGTISYVPNGCGAGTLQLQSVGTGTSTVLGSFRQTTNICINPATGAIIGSVIGTAKTANGDKLFYTFVGAGVDPATGFLFQNYVISGGTGKFEGATGNLTLLYQVNTPTNFAYTGSGSITLDKDKSKDDDD